MDQSLTKLAKDKLQALLNHNSPNIALRAASVILAADHREQCRLDKLKPSPADDCPVHPAIALVAVAKSAPALTAAPPTPAPTAPNPAQFAPAPTATGTQTPVPNTDLVPIPADIDTTQLNIDLIDKALATLRHDIKSAPDNRTRQELHTKLKIVRSLRQVAFGSPG